MLPLVERNVHQVGMLPLVYGCFHHCMFPLVEINVHKDLPLVESDNHSLPLVNIGNQEQMDPSEHVCLPLVERYGWKVLHVWLTYQRD